MGQPCHRRDDTYRTEKETLYKYVIVGTNVYKEKTLFFRTAFPIWDFLRIPPRVLRGSESPQAARFTTP